MASGRPPLGGFDAAHTITFYASLAALALKMFLPGWPGKWDGASRCSGSRWPLWPQPSQGPIISAKLFRALFRRDLTVPRLVCVISAISSYDLPSSSRSTKTLR